MHTRSSVVGALAVGVIAASAGASSPLIPTAIYSEVASSPTSQVPGLGGALFDSFDRLFRSPDGTQWILTASSDLTASEDEVVIVGDTASASGSVIAREGFTAVEGETIGFVNSRASINNSGEVVFGTNTDGPTGSDEIIVKWSGGTFTAPIREGQALPAPFGSETIGSTLDLGEIAADGSISYRAPFTDGTLDSDTDGFLVLNGNILAQEGVTAPNGQAGGSTRVWDNFDTEDFRVDATGANWLAQGDLDGDTATDDVLVLNNNVVVQEGAPINGIGIATPVDTITEGYLDSAGNWIARGDFEDDQDWLVRNGALVAATGDLVPGGIAGETFSDAIFSGTFFTMQSNNNGDFVFGATTSNPDPEADAVLVFNNDLVFARQGDPVDLDGNGLFDDDAFIDFFNNDDAFLTDGLDYFFTATLTTSDGTSLGQALLQIQVPTPGATGILAIAGLAAARRRR